VSIQSLTLNTREERSNNAQKSPSFSHTLRVLGGLEVPILHINPRLEPRALSPPHVRHCTHRTPVRAWTVYVRGIPRVVQGCIYRDMYTHHGTGEAMYGGIPPWYREAMYGYPPGYQEGYIRAYTPARDTREAIHGHIHHLGIPQGVLCPPCLLRVPERCTIPTMPPCVP